MMQEADLNHDLVITPEEFANAYGSVPWRKAQVFCCYPLSSACRTEAIYNLQGVSGLMQRIMDTWKMLDKNDDGEPMSRLHSLDTLTCMW